MTLYSGLSFVTSLYLWSQVFWAVGDGFNEYNRATKMVGGMNNTWGGQIYFLEPRQMFVYFVHGLRHGHSVVPKLAPYAAGCRCYL